jgi:hypothetical protein
MMHIHNGVLFNHKEEWNVICRKMDGIGDHHDELDCSTGACSSGPTPWATPSALFCDGLFRNRGLWTICPGFKLWSSWSLPLSSWDYRREPLVPSI